MRLAPRTTKLLLAAALAVPALASTGCVTGREHRDLIAERDAYRQAAEENEAVAYSARAEAQVYRAQLQASNRDAKAKEEALSGMTNEMVQMQAKIDSLNAAYSEAVERADSPLPPELAAELEKFAAANKDLLTYDAERGLVKFNSDVTFSPGSAELTPAAKAAAKRLASILNNGNASTMDLMVAGHTDSKPVSRSTTIKKGHKDNWYLSSHRAIAVSEAMRDAGVQSSRMAVVGYADQRPTATNATAAGRAANRRVEVIVMPADNRFSGTEVVGDHSGDWTEGTFGWMFNEEAEASTPTASTPRGPVFSK